MDKGVVMRKDKREEKLTTSQKKEEKKKNKFKESRKKQDKTRFQKYPNTSAVLIFLITYIKRLRLSTNIKNPQRLKNFQPYSIARNRHWKLKKAENVKVTRQKMYAS